MAVCLTCKTEFHGGEQFCPKDGTPLQAPTGGDRLLGRLLSGRYRLESRLGQGGMGAVYRAHHILMDKAVAVKVLRHELSSDAEAVARFHREARSASKLDHDHIIRVTDFGQSDDGQLFLVMELLDGESLAEVVHKGPLPWRRAAAIMRDAAMGLAHAHEQGIIHRDLKPENIMLARRPKPSRQVVKVLDFGLAKLMHEAGAPLPDASITRTGVVFGTPEYMSPEQAEGAALDHRTDVYALGVIGYQMIVGEVPFSAPTFLALITKAVQEEPVPPSVRRPDAEIPAELEALILRCLAKRSVDRPQSAEEVAGALELLLAVHHGGAAERSLPPLGALPAAAMADTPRSAASGTPPSALTPVPPVPPMAAGAVAPSAATAVPPPRAELPTPVPAPRPDATPRSGAPSSAAGRPDSGSPAFAATLGLPSVARAAVEPARAAQEAPGAAPPPGLTRPFPAVSAAELPTPPAGLARPLGAGSAELPTPLAGLAALPRTATAAGASPSAGLPSSLSFGAGAAAAPSSLSPIAEAPSSPGAVAPSARSPGADPGPAAAPESPSSASSPAAAASEASWEAPAPRRRWPLAVAALVLIAGAGVAAPRLLRTAAQPDAQPAQRDPIAIAQELLQGRKLDDALAVLQAERQRHNTPALQRLLSEVLEAKDRRLQALGHMYLALSLARGGPEERPTQLRLAQLLSHLGYRDESCRAIAPLRTEAAATPLRQEAEALLRTLRCGEGK